MIDDLDDGLKRLAIYENCKKCCKESKSGPHIIHTDTDRDTDRDTDTFDIQKHFVFLFGPVLGST